MRFVRVVLILLCAALLIEPPETIGCGPFIPEAQFGFVHNPGPEFLRGELGIVSPKYYRRNLVVAYRYLSGAPLTAEEIAALSPKQAPVAESPQGLQWGGPLAAARWLAARNAVPGVQRLEQIEVHKEIHVNDNYAWYRNCLDDAFDSATATLAKRAARWGEKSAQIAEWTRGQDRVFANCGGKAPDLPGALPPGADPLLLADRQYQMAAAAFYAGKYKEAEDGFHAVAANADSPWRDLAPYLLVRVLIREGTVDGNQNALAAAEESLRGILKDPKQKRWHRSARGLVDFVRSRLHPEDRMVELGAALSKPGLGAGIADAITDYTALWDRLNKAPAERSDMADWITSFQGGNRQHGIERWRDGGGAQWLVAAIVSADATDPATPDLIAAARRIRPGNPAYATVAYWGVSLQQPDEARRWADEALAAKLPQAARNAFLAERMSLARNWTEFLRYAPRRPVAASVVVEDESITESPVSFDGDAATALNWSVPLDLWVNAAGNALLPKRLQADVAQAGWVRAVILNRTAEALALARRVVALRPDLAAGMRAYEAEKSPDAAKFAAVFLMLRTPGLSPVVRSGFGRETKLDKIDNFRDNWWKLEAKPAPPAFLSTAQRSRGEKEYAALMTAANAAPDYLSAEAVAWGRAHPQDPRVPEALHLAVRATRFGLTDDATSAWSRKAFQLLHSRYPKTEWAEKTKYWY